MKKEEDLGLSRNNVFPYLETAIITAICIAIGVYFHSSDPLFMASTIPFITILLICITLFYGQKSGLLSLVLLSVVFVLYYKESYITHILVHLLLVLIVGQFYHYRYQQQLKIQKEYAYTKEKLETLTHAFYTLKISHDTLEQSYALRPYSLRSAIQTLEDLHFKKGSTYTNFLQLIAQSFHVEGSLLARFEKGTFHTMASIEENKVLHLRDPLVQKALQSQQTSYVNDTAQLQSLYLAVIPFTDKKDDVIALLAIDKMSFLNFNQNNIISLSILFSYFIDQVTLWDTLKEKGAQHVDDAVLFQHEYQRLLHLNTTYNTVSSIMIFKTDDALLYQQLTELLSTSLRALDIRLHIQGRFIQVLLPFTAKESTGTIVSKLFSHTMLEGKKPQYMVFDITESDLMKQYLEAA